MSVDARRQYFGTELTPRAFREWLADIGAGLERGRRRRLSGHHNLHSLYLLHSDPGVARFYARCDDCYIDGQPVRLLLAGFGQHPGAARRFSLMDHFEELLEHAQESGWRLYYLGSRPEVVDRARALIEAHYPRLDITLRDGYFRDDAAVVSDINARRPQLLLVGMGMPRQEHWLCDHLEALDIGCATQAGASLDYFAGMQARPPAWLSRAGLAWLYRLLHDPARLWRRYLVEPWALLPLTLRHWYRWRQGEGSGA